TAPFLDFEVVVDRGVLVPRPETELLAEWAIARARAMGHRRALDVGTGSGVLAVALARGVPGLRVHATDIVPGALAVALRNAEASGVADRIEFHLADLAPAALVDVPLIVANLPYVGLDERGAVAPGVLRHEPRVALFAGGDGLLALRRLMARLGALLAPGGDLGLEIGGRQGASALALVRRRLPRARLRLRRDLGGHPRLLVAEGR
ncbi:MAG: N5-glutamine methyltransferase family protein, partial [Anaerolineae bacterium]